MIEQSSTVGLALSCKKIVNGQYNIAQIVYVYANIVVLINITGSKASTSAASKSHKEATIRSHWSKVTGLFSF